MPVSKTGLAGKIADRLNEIAELNEEMAYVVVEPGVSYQALYDELAALDPAALDARGRLS